MSKTPNRLMAIGGYTVQWHSLGWSYAVPFVSKRVERRFLCFRWLATAVVWRGSSRGRLAAEKMLPWELEDWYQLAINEYEQYVQAWKAHAEGRV